MAKDTFFNLTKSITLCGVEYNLDQPRIIGILNLTPDSFYDGGTYKNETEILEKVRQMLEEGAWIIDIGGCSTRPGGALIAEEEEMNRVIPVVKLLSQKFENVLISVDTFRAKVAEKALSNGACMINDISGARWEPEILRVVKKYAAGYISMHSRGKFDRLHANNKYSSVSSEVLVELQNQLKKIQENGIENYLLDPGFGFSKNVEQNFMLLKDLSFLKNLEAPLLCGISRKSFIWKTLDTDPKGALNGTTAMHFYCLQNGVSVLRVHDVKEAKQTIDLFIKLQ